MKGWVIRQDMDLCPHCGNKRRARLKNAGKMTKPPAEDLRQLTHRAIIDLVEANTSPEEGPAQVERVLGGELGGQGVDPAG